MRFETKRGNERAELQLTSMIDVIFLLLIFFVMTFRIAAQEGDFNVKMPIGDSAGPSQNTNIPIKLRLRAGSNGDLGEIVVNDSITFGADWGRLRAYILEITGGNSPATPEEGPEVEIDLDYDLRYEHVIAAITAVTGQRQGDEIKRLVERIKFAPPRKSAR